MEISSLARTLRLQEEVTSIKRTQDDLSRQLVTGKKADTYGGLGSDAAVILSLRDQVSSMEGYVKTMDLVNLRLNIQSAAMTRMDEIASTLKTDALTTSFDLTGAGQTQLQLAAASQFDEIASLLNTELEGRHMFGGTDTADSPVALPDLMLNGDATRAGLKQIIAERAQADMGADDRARLALSTVGATFTVAEDADPSVFGAKLFGAVSNLSGTTITGPAGSPPALDVDFTATLPQQGEEITFDFTMPDGTRETFTLTATSVAPAGEGEFLIGADENATAANFQTAFDTALQEFTKTTVKAASASEATDNFFDSNPPQRVGSAPFSSATTLVDGTTTDTVFWYTGDTSASAPALAKIGENEIVSYGVRADDTAIVDLLKSTAILTVTTFSGADPLESKEYAEMTERVANTVSFQGTRSPLDALMEMGFLQAKIDSTKDQTENAISVSQGIIEDVENADPYEIAAKLGVIQTQLEAAYQVTSRISDLSLLNFLR
ncbi:MAG: flagellin [Parvibaculaceae bacterium]